MSEAAETAGDRPQPTIFQVPVFANSVTEPEPQGPV
jgi:hypothetical protein